MTKFESATYVSNYKLSLDGYTVAIPENANDDVRIDSINTSGHYSYRMTNVKGDIKVLIFVGARGIINIINT